MNGPGLSTGNGHARVRAQGLGICYRLRPAASLKYLFLETLRFGRKNRTSTHADDLWALRDINFNAGEGDRIGVIGPNGSGKSSLLRIIAGIYRQTEGTLACTGSVFPILDLGLGFHGELTGEENAYLALAFQGLGKKRARPLLDEIFAFCELDKFRQMALKHYSSGMRNRLTFAISTAVNPDILLLDEVFASGDAAWNLKAQRRLHHWMAASKIVFIVSHDMQHIREHCSRVLWLQGGEMLADGGIELADEYDRRARGADA